MNAFQWSDAGATEEEIAAAESTLGVALPDDFREVHRQHDGGEGWVGDGAYLRLWPLSLLVQQNQELDARKLVPGVVLIGADGAGELYGIHAATSAYEAYPAVGLSPGDGTDLGRSWDAFLTALARMQ